MKGTRIRKTHSLSVFFLLHHARHCVVWAPVSWLGLGRVPVAMQICELPLVIADLHEQTRQGEMGEAVGEWVE